ncbi:MAG: hypothetical protein KAW46_11595 [candidate division Zixibacteria bacterium]|nr:hypothetical protein [candidate division Zixibacteria bacterium]
MNDRGNHGTCKLCLQERELRRSHIIPEFFYSQAYDDLHRLDLISADAPDKVRFHQKGVRERLLCQECEQWLSPWEKHTREVFYGGCEIEIVDTGSAITLRNLDYRKLKLFQLSMLWRMGIADHQLFKEVTLGHHEDRLRSMVLRGEPGRAYDYGCFLLALVDEKNRGIDGVIGQVEKKRDSGHHLYAVVVGSCWWVFVVSSHTEMLPFREFFLQDDGTLTINRQLAWKNPFIAKLISGVRRAHLS